MLCGCGIRAFDLSILVVKVVYIRQQEWNQLNTQLAKSCKVNIEVQFMFDINAKGAVSVKGYNL